MIAILAVSILAGPYPDRMVFVRCEYAGPAWHWTVKLHPTGATQTVHGMTDTWFAVPTGAATSGVIWAEVTHEE